MFEPATLEVVVKLTNDITRQLFALRRQRALDEGRLVATAQTYQIRAQLSQDAMLSHAESEHCAPIAIKIGAEGWDSLSDEERWRYEKVQMATLGRIDNMHYQFQNGFLDRESYENLMDEVKPFVKFWKYLGILKGRRSLIKELESVLDKKE